MKCSTARWTTAMAAAALIGLPSAGFAQTAAPQTPPSQTSPAQTTPTPTSTQGQATSSSATSPADHIREAKQALASIPSSAVPEASRGKLGQLKTHLNNLDKLVAKGGETATSGTTGAKKGASSWGTEAAAVDKLVSELSAEATDDAAKQKLMEVRRHVTEVAGSMSGTGSTGQDQATAASSSASPDTMGANPSASQQSTPTSAAANPTPSATDPTSAGATQSPSSATNPSAAPQSTATSPSTSPQSTPSEPSAAQQPPAAGQPGQLDVQAAKQHLSDARDALAQLTSLPEANKLQGEARTQVSQLISNFNELITTQTDWKAAYAKVTANLDTLIGPDSSSPAAATGMSGTTAAPTATAGTTGAAGAAGPAMAIEPALKAKLQEVRTHLKAFEQAAGGAPIQSAAGSQTPGAMAPSASPSSTSSPATSPSTPSAASTTPEPTNAPMPTGTSGATTPSAAGTTGSAAPTATDSQSKSAASPSESAGHSEADKHLDAIQDILSKAKDGKLDKEQTDQIKTHLEQLRQLLAQSK
jgi:hypothetical protein